MTSFLDDITDFDYFPDCQLPGCHYNDDCSFEYDTVRTERHQHILPKQLQILNSTAKYLFCQGGVGSMKTVAFAAKCVKLSLTVPRNEGAVCRLQLKDAYKSTWRDIKACIRRLVQRGKIAEPKYEQKTQGDYSKITFHESQSVMYCIPGKNWSDALGPSYGWFWVDDAMETDERLFTGDDTNAGLISRLRLQEAEYDPVTYHIDNREYGSLHGMVSTNPPPIGHFSHQLFGDKPGLHMLKGTKSPIEWIMTSSMDNPFTGNTYTGDLIAIQKQMGKSENTIDRIIHGRSIPAYGGVPVFPQFSHKRHVAPLKFIDFLPIIRSWDFGYHHPAVIFSHIHTCKYGTTHFFTLSEIADARALTVHDLYKRYVIPHTQRLYGKSKMIVDCGDRAGYRQSSSTKDGRSDMKILMNEYNLAFRHRYMIIEPSLQYMRGLLDPDKPCKCGMEIILINASCTTLIGALEGGYKYSKPQHGPVKDKPVPDGTFIDVADAWRYGAENYVKWGMDWVDQKAARQQGINLHSGRQLTDPWDWMNQSDEQFVEMLTV